MINYSNKNECCGCTACASICTHSAIIMQSDELGFKYPNIDNTKCVDCGLCSKVCPMRQSIEESADQQFITLHHPEDNIRLNSSSGGVFTLLAEQIIKQGGSVFGVIYDKDMIVRHTKACTTTQTSAMRTSKYAQSVLDGIFAEVKIALRTSDAPVLFVGTPCQVHGLKLFLNRKYNNLITVDLICHGVSSPRLLADYITFIEKKTKKKVSFINMKDKTNGWLKPNSKIYYTDNTSEINTLESNMCLSMYYSKIAYRPSCSDCHYANLKRVGDITIGDFWTKDKKYDKNIDVRKGESLCIVNTSLGGAFLKMACNGISLQQQSKELCIQQALDHPMRPHDQNKQFWDDYSCLSFDRIASKYFNYTYTQRIKYHIKKLLRW